MNTEISYELDENIKSAFLYIYDMQGAQIDKFALSRGDNSVIIIEGGRLKAGMYLYSLIADGKVIDTKQMILTK